MTVEETLTAHGIKLASTAPGQHYATCPQCSAKRQPKNQSVKCLGVKIESGERVCWHCCHCEWSGPEKGSGRRQPRITYLYRDADGAPRFRKVRNLPGREPRFWLQRPDGKGGWIKGTKGVDTSILYRRDEVDKAIKAGHEIACVEGEKDADNLWALGIAATCNAHGAHDPTKKQKPKWKPEHSEQLRDADIIVFNDNDVAGYEHAGAVCRLSLAVAKRVRRLDLKPHWPDIAKGADVSDWLALGHTREELDGLIAQAPVVEAERARVQILPPPSAPMTVFPSPAMPMAVARLFVAEHCLNDGVLTLHHWRGGWWQWRRSHWCEVEDRRVQSLLYAFTENATYLDAEGYEARWAPNRRKIGDLLEALAAVTILANDTDQPTWLDGRESGIIVAVANGLLEVETRRLLPHSPMFFNQTAVPFSYDADAPPPDRWLVFLDALWPTEPAAIDVLGEWFGYVISGRLDLHKILLMVGPTRGGKGVIARILTALVGRANVAGPTLNSLGGEFGLAPLIGKSLAVISDARFVGKNSNIVVERLLSISGEDTLTVNRKYREQWTGKLPSRLHVISNELPHLGDASTAIVGRIVLLLLSLSWLGKEDHSLETGLQAELPGILNWALDGLERLIENNNRFTRLPSADDAIVTLRDLASPVGAFVRECCDRGVGKEVIIDDLYSAYRSWCEDNGHAKKTKQTFGRDLRAVVLSIRTYRPRDGEDRRRRYTGIALRPGNEPAPADETDDLFQVETALRGTADHADQGAKNQDGGSVVHTVRGPTQSRFNAREATEPRSDDLPYTGPVIAVPGLGLDPLDEHGAPLPPYEVLGAAPPGARCTICGRRYPRRIKYGERESLWHRDCAERFIATLARAAVASIDTGIEPGLGQARIRELRQWCLDRAEAQRRDTGEVDQAEIEEDLRIILREEVLPEFIEAEFERVIAAVYGGA